MQQKTISVMGCGWLGLPLAQAMVQAGYRVHGSTTTQEKLPILAAQGIEPFLLTFPEKGPETQLSRFLQADVLVFNLPPSRQPSSAMPYEQVVEQVLAEAAGRVKHVLFVSSTSVYPDLNREITEADALAAANADNLLLRCEHQVQQWSGNGTTVVRFGGLMGGTRHPGRFLAGKDKVAQPQAPVNMIHLSDCVQILFQIITQNKWKYTFNACAPLHPSRQQFYTTAAHHLQLPPPTFSAQGEPSFKLINSDLVNQELQYQFRYPDPLSCLSSPGF
ncbi:SDR family oxidoreductase [Rufibacter immobilis]|nr:SDR family oxidoreductase [Rufibacter immobilis]